MSYQNIKLEFFYWRKAFFEYKKGFKYFKNRYFLAVKILKKAEVLERPINTDNLSVHILSCHRHLIMLIWSLASFYQVMDAFGELYVHSDGTLNKKDKKILNKFFPSARIIEPQEFLEEYRGALEKYPLIKEFRFDYPQFFLLKKLIDPYFVSDKKRRLIIDSDLIWFKKPEIIEENINSQKSLMMQGRVGAQANHVYFKDGSRLVDKLANYNSGIVLYAKENFNLGRLIEFLEKIDLNRKENEHFIEQAGYAYSLDNLHGLPEGDYQIKDAARQQTIVKHYTAPRRPWFYLEGLELLKNKFLN